MRASLAILLAVAVAGCATVKPAPSVAPLGRGLELRLPVEPGYPTLLAATQTVVGRYGERRAAFQAVLELSPARAEIVLTTPGGPRILSVTWTSKGIVENRTALAPAELKGVNVLGDIFVSLWPVEQVQAALPAGLTAEEDGALRVIRGGDRVVMQVETLEQSEASMRQKVRNFDFGYELTVVTERGG